MSKFDHVSIKSPMTWEIGGESVLFCDTQPAPPKSGEPTTVRISHSNVYGPVDDVAFYIRVGDLNNPTAFDDLDSATDWMSTTVSVQTVYFNDEERLLAEVAERMAPREEYPWTGTFVATVELPAGENRLEIKVVSTGMLPSGIISDWELTVE